MMEKKLGKIFNYIAASVLLLVGLIYMFKSGFMPYHSAAVSLKWVEVDAKFQYLILALMRAIGGLLLSLSLVTFFLQYKFEKTKETWIPGLILSVGLIICVATIYATLIVRLNSPGRPPTFLAVIGIALLYLGFYFNKKMIKKN